MANFNDLTFKEKRGIVKEFKDLYGESIRIVDIMFNQKEAEENVKEAFREHYNSQIEIMKKAIPNFDEDIFSRFEDYYNSKKYNIEEWFTYCLRYNGNAYYFN